MKISANILLGLAGLLAGVVLHAQATNQTTNATSVPPPSLASVSDQDIQGTLPPPGRVPPLQPPPPIPQENLRMGGLIGDAAQMKKPLELFNPLAPPEYGNGLQNLSLNPHTGQAQGVTLLSFPFKSKPAAPKKPKPVKPKAKP